MRKLILLLLLAFCIVASAQAEIINVSEGKTATTSSIYGDNYGPEKGVNGNTGDFTHSANNDRSPWWMVDLGQEYLVSEVVLWNRSSCCQVRLQDITVEILAADQSIIYVSPLINPGNVLAGPANITLTLGAPTPGRFVRVSRTPNAPSGNHDTYILSLGEVEVLADTEGTGQAWAPLPLGGATDVPLDVTLSWSDGLIVDPGTGEIITVPNLAEHVVSMSSGSPSDPNVYEIDRVSTGELGPLVLDFDKVYYWRVDEVTDTNTIQGALWSFETESSNPAIDENTPADQLVDPGEPAVFEISAINPTTGDDTGLSYEWFMEDEGGDIPLGEDLPILEIVDPNESHEGLYYCRVTTVSSGQSTESARVPLIIKRLMHHWPFDGNAEDIVGDFHGSDIGDPDYSVPGVSGSYCVDLDEDDAIKIDQGDGLIYKFSISAWVSHRGLPNNFHSIIHQDGWTTSSMHWHLRSDKSFSWGINGAGGDGRTVANAVPEDDTWYHLVISYDNGLARAYIDGELFAEVQAANLIPIRFLPGTIGAWKEASGNFSRFLNGKVDDVRIYNYPVDSLDLARLYHEVTGEEVCVQELKPEYDLNDDCVTDLKDIALLAATWMECNRIPTIECE